MNNSSIPVITIDGPSASGKGTVAQLVAQKLGFHYLDSGALYRIVALAAHQKDIPWVDESAVAECANNLEIRFNHDQVMLNNQDVSELIRSEKMGKGASQVAVHPNVRAALVTLQHSFRKAPGLVADGRDMGTVIFPDAALKIFLTASTETRAVRRYKQLLGKNLQADYYEILLDLQERDARDKNRASAPLIMAEHAVLLKTDNLDINEAVNFVLRHFETANKKQ
ncbi:MAG: cytidylate kinase [Methylotenera sp.]|nr:MAG: cytidylate kinase [Methylotenera sp.]